MELKEVGGKQYIHAIIYVSRVIYFCVSMLCNTMSFSGCPWEQNCITELRQAVLAGMPRRKLCESKLSKSLHGGRRLEHLLGGRCLKSIVPVDPEKSLLEIQLDSTIPGREGGGSQCQEELDIRIHVQAPPTLLLALKTERSGINAVFEIYTRGKPIGQTIDDSDDIMIYYLENSVWVGHVENSPDCRTCPGENRPPPPDKYDMCWGEVFKLWLRQRCTL